MAGGSVLHTWHPAEVLTYLSATSPGNFACLLLNRPLDGRHVPLWNQASLRVAVDGGANVLREVMTGDGKRSDSAISRPHLITGDFDSITDETRKFFSDCELVETADQDETDFTKAVRVVAAHESSQFSWVTVLADSSGRLDQILANISTLHRAARLLPQPLYLVAHDSLSWLLNCGRHRVVTPAPLRRSWCSLVPVGEPARSVTTTGLRWNLSGDGMRFGELVSTSNQLMADEVTVDTSHPLLLSMEIP